MFSAFESRRRPRCGDHLVASRSEIRYEMASDEAIGAGHEHSGSIIHASAYKARICGRDDLTIGGPSTNRQAEAAI